MTTFLATDAAGYGRRFPAASWAAAEAHCAAEGWEIAGVFRMELPARDFTEADMCELVDRRNRWGLS